MLAAPKILIIEAIKSAAQDGVPPCAVLVTTSQSAGIQGRLTSLSVVYPLSGLQTIAAEKLFPGDEDVIQSCRGRIVLIGSNWRDDRGTAIRWTHRTLLWVLGQVCIYTQTIGSPAR